MQNKPVNILPFLFVTPLDAKFQFGLVSLFFVQIRPDTRLPCGEILRCL